MIAGIHPLKTNACVADDMFAGRTIPPIEIAALLEECRRIINRMLPFVLL